MLCFRRKLSNAITLAVALLGTVGCLDRNEALKLYGGTSEEIDTGAAVLADVETNDSDAGEIDGDAVGDSGADFVSDAEIGVLSDVQDAADVSSQTDSGDTLGNDVLDVIVEFDAIDAQASSDSFLGGDVPIDLQPMYKITCKSAVIKNGVDALIYDFKGLTSGVMERMCTLFNAGPAPILLQSWPMVELVGEKPSDLTKIYAVKETKSDGNTLVSPIYAIVAGKFLDFNVKLTVPTDGTLPPQAQLAIAFSQVPLGAQTLTIPIVTGGDASPALAVGPNSVWQVAAVGKTSTATIVLANQSPSPLQLMDACILPANLNLDLTNDPCGSNSASKQSALVPTFSSQAMAPWALLPLQIAFNPKDDKKINNAELLHITWCSSNWDGAKCVNNAVVVRSISLTGNVQATIAQPTFTVPKNASYAAAAVGKPLTITGVYGSGVYPGCGDTFAWVIKSRPDGSASWVSKKQQNTDSPMLTFVPDVAGEYTILGMAMSCSGTDPAIVSWSTQASISLKILP